jgi:hypothetical protein
MSSSAETPVKRGPGRPRKIQPPPPPVVETDDGSLSPEEEKQILACDLGDIAARESWTQKSGHRFAERGDFAPTMSYLPDLSHPGTLGNQFNPANQTNRAWLEEDGSRHARQTAMLMRQKGWRPATVQDGYIICPELREAIRADDSGRLVLADTNGKSAAVVMVRSQADYARDRKQLLRHSDDIQLTAEEKAARLQESMRRAGASGVVASSKMEDDFGA